MGGSKPHILLIGGDGGRSGVPAHIRMMAEALQSRARLTVISDVNRGGYDGLASFGVDYQELEGLASSLSPHRQGRTRRALGARIDALQPDLVWPHARMAVHLARSHLARRPGRYKLAVTYHGLPFGPGHRPGLSLLSRGLETRLLRRLAPHHLVFLSEAARTQFCRVIGPRSTVRHQTHVLPNCSQLDPVPRNVPAGRAARWLVMTGRSGWQKNLTAAARLMAHLPDTTYLALCGDGTDSPALRRAFARHLDPAALARVRFCGPLSDVRRLLSEADGYLLTSRYEGMPIGALEAFEAGLPLILPQIDGMAEIAAVHPACLVTDLTRPAEAAPQITALLDQSRAKGDALSADIRAAWAKEFSWGIWESRLHGLVDRLLS